MPLDPCGCEPRTDAPDPVENRPGLDQIAYRVGIHPTFLRRILRTLSVREAGAGQTEPNLKRLTTRALDDPAIALADAFAAMADVLTFYQERIANEGYLRTATERRSLLELARTIGYELGPGVAASAYLQFGVEDRAAPVPQPDATQAPPLTATVDAGTQVKSLPGPGELPQTFETSAALVARGDWNELRPRLTRPKDLNTADQQIFLRGVTTGLEIGDLMLLYSGSGDPVVKRVFQIETDTAHDRTRIDFADQPAPVPPPPKVTYSPGTLTLDRLDFTESVIEDRVIRGRWRDDRLRAFLSIQGWRPRKIVTYARKAAAAPPPPALPSAAPGVYAFRQRAASFGHNAQPYESLPPQLRRPSAETEAVAGTGSNPPTEKKVFQPAPYPTNWDTTPPDVFHNSKGQVLASAADTVRLDTTYPKIQSGSWVLLVPGSAWPGSKALRVHKAGERSAADYAMSAKVTELGLQTVGGANPTGVTDLKVRDTTVLAQSERLELAPIPLSETIPKGTTTLELDRIVLDWPAGQPLAFTGERDDVPGVVDTDVVLLTDATHEGGATTLEFSATGIGFVRKTLTISANVVAATHGEIVRDEPLGSSNGSANQRFTLRNKPLTYVSAPSAAGARSTLEVRVDGIRWDEVPSLYGREPDERCYVIRRDDDGTAHVVFGDGVQGARPPSGVENVRATYRHGIGAPGMVAERKLTLLQTRPLGIRDVVNPTDASGAEDPEQRDMARQNAPLTVMTLDRVVSLTDYEDFARAFAGIGKATATELWRGDDHLVHVTVAGPDGAEVLESSDTYRNLVAAIAAANDPGQSFRVASFARIYFDVVANVLVDERYDANAVIAAVKAALAERFSFARRSFGEGVSEAEVIETVLAVDGTIDTSVTGLAAIAGGTPPAVPAKEDPLLASLARWVADESDEIEPAQLLLLNPAGATVTERTT